MDDIVYICRKTKNMGDSGKKAPAKKPPNSYSLLQMKMKEVEKSKRPASSSKNYSSNNQKREEKKRDYSPQKETRDSSKPMKQEELGPNEPDRSYGDYFCRTCDSHMNSSEMWIAHITGKRHIKNVKKGDTDSKYEDLDEESAIKYEMRNVKDPVIGLNYIHEIRRREPNVPAMYNCFLCHASIATVPLVTEHVIGLKHRLNFMRENDPDAYALMEQTNLKKGHLEPIVAEKAAKLEEEFGRGVVKVKQEKAKIAFTPYKRNYDSDDDRPPKKSKSQKSEAPVVWKSIDVPSRDYRDEYDSRRHYPEDRVNDDYLRSRSFRDNLSADRSFRENLSADRSFRENLSADRSYRENLSADRSYRENLSADRDRDDYLRSYSRQSDHDDYRKDDYSRSRPDDYLRSDTQSRYSYARSPEREVSSSNSISKRVVLNDKFSSLEFSDARHFLEARSQDRTMQSSGTLPTTSAAQSSGATDTSADGVKAFINQLYSLPVKLFLKVTAQRMEEWKTIDVGKEEMELFLKIHMASQHIIHRNLPPQIQAMLKDNITSKIENGQNNSATSASLCAPAVQPSMPQSAQTNQSSHKFTMDDINELVFGARKASESSAPNQQAHLSTYNPAPTVSVSSSHVSSHYSAPLSSPNFIPPANSMPPPATNFPPQGGNFPIPNRFPPPASSLPPPGNFGSPSDNYTSPNNPSSSGARYTTYQANPNSGIPGLTLAESETRQNPPPQSEFSPYRWSSQDETRRDVFKRY